MIHSASAVAVDRARQQPAVLLQLPVHLVEDRLRLARVAAGREHEEVRVDAHGPHVEDDDVFCQLLARESGDPACLFERSQSTQCSREYPDVNRRGRARARRCIRATAGATRPSIGSPRARRVADLGGGDRMRLELEDLECAGEAARRRVARARGDAEPRQLEHPLRLLPGREVGELVGADQEDRVVVAGRFERVDGVACSSSSTVASSSANASERHREAVAGRGLRRLVRRIGDDGDVQVVEAEVLHGGPCEREVTEVRRVEAAAEDAGYCHSRVSSPISTSWPLRAPPLLSTASSSSPCGASPMIRKPRSVR